MTQRPELFGAVLCGVPLLDMLRYHRFGSGRTWVPEYGNPEVEADFQVLAAYSPYRRITPGTKYPPLLMLSADHDDRVDPLHARKFVAGLADASPDAGPYLLRVEANAGHGGADLRKASVEQAVDEIVFLRAHLGVGP
jgi:prolyl oligopeptidase